VRKPQPAAEEAAEREEVATPDASTIAALAEQLGIGPERTAKAAFFVDQEGRLITAIVRGDYEVNETKLGNATGATDLRPARTDEIAAAGMVAGYASPIGAHDTLVVVDDLVAASRNLVAGANRQGFHLRNVNVPRDYTPDKVIDIVNARAGDACPQCGGEVRLANGIEVGNIFKLGTRYTAALGSTYLGEDGERHPIVMGSYGIGLGRSLACVVEAHHDEKGIVWPEALAPYRAHLVAIGGAREARVTEEAEGLYRRLTDAGVELLYDDRDESAGVKFTDAELLGMPLIITVSPRSLAAGGAEVTVRATGERSVRPIAELEAELVGAG
ncbi:MAG TPA: YbaK/EbsC family protein, partial [Candidatus Limnocylindria bacterium]|nr:YbaK/EbsC family protein [Candidatus Limnocylindria bacterium]